MLTRWMKTALTATLCTPIVLHAMSVHSDPATQAQPRFREALLALAHKDGSMPLDAAALGRFKVLIEHYGWPTVAAVGQDGVDAAGQLLERATRDDEFQSDVESAIADDLDIDIDARAFAMLNDRIEISHHRPQQFGSLFAVTEGHVMLSPPLSSFTQADQLRASIGLPTVAEDIRRLEGALRGGGKATSLIAAPALSTPMRRIEMPKLRQELHRMAQDDQAARNSFIQSGMKRGSAEQAQLIKVDAANLTRLKAIFAAYGFPDRSKVGRQGVQDTWLLVQHATKDKPLMRQALNLAAPLMQKGDLSRSDYALLTDRVLLGEGKKQIYGSQLTGKSGHLVVQPLEDPAHVDERRAAMGLMPLATYIAQTDAFYTPKASPDRHASASAPSTDSAH